MVSHLVLVVSGFMVVVMVAEVVFWVVKVETSCEEVGKVVPSSSVGDLRLSPAGVTTDDAVMTWKYRARSKLGVSTVEVVTLDVNGVDVDMGGVDVTEVVASEVESVDVDSGDLDGVNVVASDVDTAEVVASGVDVVV